MNEIVIPYYPRPIWGDVIHPALDTKNRAVIVCHRRFGKTIGAINEMIIKAGQNTMLMPRYAYVAPYRVQAKKIAWEWLKHFTKTIPQKKINESELYVELPTYHEGSPGARIYIVGADKPDNLRGDYLDGCILDEFAQIKKSLYGEVIIPMVTDRNGFIYIVGTPKGQNHFYEKYLKAQKNPERWFSCLYRVDESKVLTEEQINDMKAEMTPDEIRQELYCDFTASASNVVMPIDLVSAAAKRVLTERDVYGMPVIFALDVARFGDNDSVLTIRQGLFTRPQLRWHGLNTMELAARMAAEMMKHNPAIVNIDGGAMGPGVIDRLRQLGWQNIVEVNFGQAPMDPRYANARAEMYFLAKEHLEAGGCIPDDSDLKTELTVTEYSFTAAGKIQLQSKAKIKELTGRSPDGADSFALTFATPVNAAMLYECQQREIENQEYDPYRDL